MMFALWLCAAFVLSTGLGLILTPLVILGAFKLRLFDSPGARRLHQHPVPRLGGVSVYLSAALVIALLFFATEKLFISAGASGDEQIRFFFGALVGSAILFLVGLVDDVRGLSPAVKAVAQIGAACIAWYFGAGFDAIALGYGEGVRLGMFALPLFLVWVVGVTNAVNFIDGLNGLAGGVAVVGFTAISIAALALGNIFVIPPSVAIAGALIGFLRYNYPRGRIFLGDSGSLSIGFLLAILSLRATVNTTGAVLVAIPLFAMFVPLIDGTLAIARRWLRHAPLTGADARHIHHRLLAMGISEQRTTIVLWTLAAGMSGLGLLLALTAPFVATSIAIFGLVCLSVLVIYGTNLLSYHELSVAGEVLLSAPSRARRVISDQILATDLATLLHGADSIAEVASLISQSAEQFGFLAMELTGKSIVVQELGHDRIMAHNWAWKLDYPLRIGHDSVVPDYALSIWCRAEVSTRPYGAERIARIVGPALSDWLDAKDDPSVRRMPAHDLLRRSQKKKRTTLGR
jgi:UDP-GlcNAc:undecaprenyl-phosphate GlcNAc-1-phosphate transferase